MRLERQKAEAIIGDTQSAGHFACTPRLRRPARSGSHFNFKNGKRIWGIQGHRLAPCDERALDLQRVAFSFPRYQFNGKPEAI